MHLIPSIHPTKARETFGPTNHKIRRGGEAAFGWLVALNWFQSAKFLAIMKNYMCKQSCQLCVCVLNSHVPTQVSAFFCFGMDDSQKIVPLNTSPMPTPVTLVRKEQNSLSSSSRQPSSRFHFFRSDHDYFSCS